MIVEIDIPLLTVSVPEKVYTRSINLNDDLQIDIDYYKPPDLAFYSLIYIYNFEIVATRQFDYTSFKFKIWDLYSNFDRSRNNLVLRVSLYDPEFFMPSMSSFNVLLNLPPHSGSLTISPSTGVSLDTEFLIRASDFLDED